MVNTAVDEMAPAFNGGLRNIYDKKFGEVMGKTGNLALAKKQRQQYKLQRFQMF